MANISVFARADKQPPVSRDGNTVTFEELWHLQLDDKASPVEAESLISALAVGNAYSWPSRMGIDPHPDNSSLKPTGFTAEHMDQATFKFDVNLSYTTDIDASNSAQSALDADPVYSFQNVDVIVEVDEDPINQKAIAATNGEGVFPKVQRKGTNKRITVSRNETNYNPNRALQYENRMNKTTMRIDGRPFPPRTLLLEGWTGKTAIDNDGTLYYQVQYQFLFDPATHKIELIDAASGPDKNGTNPQLYNLTSGKSHKLDGSGIYMGRSRQNDPTDYVVNTFYVHDEINMSFLRL